jgi:myo-inositol-1(or 4)-monophosphatase
MAAGALLVREAGGLVGDLDGEDRYLDSGRIVASNGKIFGAMLNVLRAPASAGPAPSP